VYSIPALVALPLRVENESFALAPEAAAVPGLARGGISEEFSVASPVSLYGATKLASERLALEYGSAYGFPVWVNRCGVMAGAGQFGHPAQGIFAFWVNSYMRGRPLRYTGFGGTGHQVRDCLHPRDLARLVLMQLFRQPTGGCHQTHNVSGGLPNSMSLAQLTEWCEARYGARDVDRDETERPFDVPWLVLDHSRATEQWNWRPEIPILQTLGEIAHHAEQHPDWLTLSSAS
jgi:CDP-paratose 2-epimerase